MALEQGQTAVVVPVPVAEPIVSAWRERYDSSAARGLPAHITALYPFLPEPRLTDEVLAVLRGLCAALPELEVTFARTGRFPGVLYLEPEPASGLQRLTLAIAERWPQAPPYAGRFAEIVPHLTVAHGVGDDVLHHVEAALAPRLPFRAGLAEARLYVLDGERWRQRARLPLGF